MNLSLAGRNALICGASRGIGRACAHALAELGATCVVAARDANQLLAVAQGLPGTAAQHHRTMAVDVSDSSALADAVAGLVAELGAVHVLVNNTGGPPAGPAHRAELADFEAAFRQHLLANQILVRGVIDGMKHAKFGRIVNVISTSVKEPITGLGVSNTIRGAVGSWAKTLATELGPFGITVNNVLPGFTATERLDYIFRGKADKQDLPIDEVIAAARREVPLGRFADPAEIANAVAFLASPAASYITGINLPVDGGRTRSL